MTPARLDKQADLGDSGIGNYAELEHSLPRGDQALLTPKETQQAMASCTACCYGSTHDNS